MQAGQTLSHYQIVEKLGEGGMGVVYRARDTNLDRFVAVKVLPPDKVADPERKRRFAQEAKTASALNHPNIITIHDIGSARGADFIVMEFVKGKTLDQLIAKKGMALGEALKYAVQIADALAAAAAAGVIHRDLKPGNVMVTESGLVKVLDFGLAKLTEPSSAGDPELTASVAAATEEGAILGTVSYMSPEQAEGRKLDGRSDIFSFGALLYEMLTGQKAFQGETKMSTLVAILHKEPKPLSEVSGGLPREMERIITRCLRKDLDRRWQSMADLRVALRDLKEESESGVGFFPEVAVPPRKARRVPRWVWIALTAVAVGLGGVAVWRLPRAASPTPASVRVVPLTTLEGSETHPSFSPDGSHVAFAWNGGRGNDDIYLKMVGAGTPVRLTSDPARDAHPEWSPDGRWIAYLHDLGSHRWEVRLIAPFGGAERRLAETQADQVTGTSFLAWFPDGKQLVVRDEGGKGQPPGLFAMSAETGERVRLTTSPDDDSGPALSPDGRTLAFGRGGAGAHTGLYLLSLSEDHKPQGEPRRLVASARPPSSAAWTPDGREIVYSFFREHGYQMWRVAASGSAKPERLEWAGNDARHPTFSRGLQGGAWRFAFVQRFLQVNLVRYAIPSTESKAVGEPVVASTRTEQDPDYAPDGKKIAYASDQSGSYEIWVSE
ncbi:MAG: protein kinase, partial [Candidatus Solibacter usitatus]|nr:protein kinase [Candidatus Solibacter usitatus]